MAEQRTQRRLAAILAADVVGYSHLIEQDELGTLTALKRRRTSILQPLVEEHHGRIIKVMGDGVLVEFASVVNAVACAFELQKRMAAANEAVPENRHIVLRVGINLGDVVVEGGDLYGDGIIVAARLQEVAPPGGICVTGKVYDEVRRKLDVTFEDAGEQTLKNIADALHVYRIGGSRVSEIQPRHLPLPDKPSIAVLPFTNLSGDAEQQYFSDGITEDIITELTRYRQLFVIARNSSFAFRDKPVEITEVGRRLGVHYVVEGSVRKGAGRVRITAQLIDSATGNHLWAERYDRDVEDVFAVQDDVTQSIVAALFGQVQDAGAQRAKRKRPESYAAYDYLLRGLELQQRQGKENLSAARHMLAKAIEIDPNLAVAYAYMALVDQGEWDFAGSAALLDRAYGIAFGVPGAGK
jgi:TolB-like protein/class 3 adenylate cyclase